MRNFTDSLPPPRVAALRGGAVLNWGILAPGEIARDFVRAMHAHTDQRAIAVAGRSPGRARAFAEAHGIGRSHESHEALVSDPDVDIVYVASPHSEHKR